MSGIWISGIGQVDRSDVRLRYPTWSPIWQDPDTGGELWMGGTHSLEDYLYGMAGADLDKFAPQVTTKDFDSCATLYAAAGAVDWGVAEYRYGFGDNALAAKDQLRAYAVADWVMSELEQGHRVLVRCQAGLNRSGLVTSLVLCQRAGMTGAEAIALIRSKRTLFCLANPDFRAHIEEAFPAA
jgi:hypothetical protein